MLAVVAVLLPGAAWADARQDALTDISRCSVIADDRGFVDCIDRVAQQLHARLRDSAAPAFLPPQPGPRAPQTAGNAPHSSRRGGLLRGMFGTPHNPSLNMASYTFDDHGFFTVALRDGEIWRQLNSDRKRAHWRAPAANYRVTVKEGIFGAAILEVAGDQTHYLVERLR